MFGTNSKKAVENADVVLIVGTCAFPEVFPSLELPFRADAKVYHIDLDSYEIAKNHPVTLGLCANPRITLQKINKELERTALPYRKERETELLAEKKKVHPDIWLNFCPAHGREPFFRQEVVPLV